MRLDSPIRLPLQKNLLSQQQVGLSVYICSEELDCEAPPWVRAHRRPPSRRCGPSTYWYRRPRRVQSSISSLHEYGEHDLILVALVTQSLTCHPPPPPLFHAVCIYPQTFLLARSHPRFVALSYPTTRLLLSLVHIRFISTYASPLFFPRPACNCQSHD